MKIVIEEVEETKEKEEEGEYRVIPVILSSLLLCAILFKGDPDLFDYLLRIFIWIIEL